MFLWEQSIGNNSIHKTNQKPLTFAILILLIISSAFPFIQYSINYQTPNKTSNHISLNQPDYFSGFIENKGQFSNSHIFYYYQNENFLIGFSKSEVIIGHNLQTKSEVKSQTAQFMYFSIKFSNSYVVKPTAQQEISHNSNYFIGNNSYTNVPTWNEIWYNNIYPNIDLRYYIKDQHLKYDFIVHPGANPNEISIKASTNIVLAIHSTIVNFLSKSNNNNILLSDSGLKTYQKDGNVVTSEFIKKDNQNNEYGFEVNGYDTSADLIIDPSFLNFSVLIGASIYTTPNDIVVDQLGNIYVIGTTSGLTFPTNITFNSYSQKESLNELIFVLKLNPSGNKILFTALIGGTDRNQANSIGVDEYGNIYLTGWTDTADFPFMNAFDSLKIWSFWQAFVLKLDSSGTKLLYSTLLGGNGTSVGESLAIDKLGNCYITGYTTASNFPLINAYNSTPVGNISGDILLSENNIFLIKFSPNGVPIYSTYLGAGHGLGIALDKDNNIYLTGDTNSWFPHTNEYGTNLTKKYFNGFLAKFNVNGSKLLFGTVYGGYKSDSATDIAVSPDGFSYITGWTDSADFPFLNWNNTNDWNGPDNENGFVMKFSQNGSLIFSNFIAGDGSKISIDSKGNSYVTGFTSSSNFPAVNPFHNSFKSIVSTTDVFYLILNSTGNDLILSMDTGQWGGFGEALAVDNSDNSYIAEQSSLDYPFYSSCTIRYGFNTTQLEILKFNPYYKGLPLVNNTCIPFPALKNNLINSVITIITVFILTGVIVFTYSYVKKKRIK